MNIPAPVRLVLNLLKEHGFESYLVGGCVRDAIMGIEPKDYDVTTNALPEDTMRIFRSFPVIETGIIHGTVMVVIDSFPVEITTYRIEGEYRDKRRPSSVMFTDSVNEDLSRRDFTINAMAYSETEGLVDPFGGQKDIIEKRIRCVGDPSKRFEEDALRILRAVRFSAVLGFRISTETKKALMDHMETVTSVAMERIASEFSGMICGNNIGHILEEYPALLTVFIPEIKPMIGFEQHNPYHIFDVYSHTIRVVENSPQRLAVRLAALFHDIGKPHTYFLDDDGIGHFYGHQKCGAGIAEEILNRMKYDNETKIRVRDLIENHDIWIQADPKVIKRILNRFSESFLTDLIDLKKADVQGQNPNLQGRLTELDRILILARQIIEENQCFSLKDLELTGKDLISNGIPPGILMGKLLEDCLQKVIEEQLPNRREVLLRHAVDNYEEIRRNAIEIENQQI